MTKTIIHFAFCLLSALILHSSCSYSPDDTFFKTVDEPILPSDGLFYVPFNQDTIQVVGNARLAFEFAFEDDEIYEIEVIANDQEARQTISSRTSHRVAGYFTLNHITNYGIYNLTINVYVKTNSNSLADKIGQEVFIFSNSWVVDYWPYPPQPQFKFVGEEDGSLKVEWEAMDLLGFQKMTITKYFDDTYRALDIEVDNIQQNYIFDNNYIGGEVAYKLTLHAGGYQADSEVYTVNLFDLNYQITQNDSLQKVHTWDPTPFYKNLRHYEIAYDRDTHIDYRTNYSAPVILANASDCIFIEPDGLFPARNYRLRAMVNLSDNTFHSENAISETILVNSPAEAFVLNKDKSRIMAENIIPYNIYGRFDGYLAWYNAISDNLQISDLASGHPLLVSGNGKYIINGNYLMDKNTWITKGHDLKNKLNFLTSFYGSISDNGILMTDSPYGEFYAYDLNTESLIGRITSSYWILQPSISPNGEYVVFKGNRNNRFEIWKKSPDGGYEEVFQHFGEYLHGNVLFEPGITESRFFIVNDGKMEYWSCDQQSLIKTMEGEALGTAAFDPVTRNLVGYDLNFFVIWNLETGKVVQEVGYVSSAFYASIERPYPVIVDNILYFDGLKLNLNPYEKKN